LPNSIASKAPASQATSSHIAGRHRRNPQALPWSTALRAGFGIFVQKFFFTESHPTTRDEAANEISSPANLGKRVSP
jgi:hypothetical protein